jgi:LCP family protein required for cell wall assembly
VSDDHYWYPPEEAARSGASPSVLAGRSERAAGQLPPPRAGDRIARPAAVPPARRPSSVHRNCQRRRVLRWATLSLCTVLVVTLGVAAYLVETLSANIRHQALLQPGEVQAAEPVDGFGDSPMNVLVLGSDTRDTAADCAIGGDCGAGANADVEMVVHLSADRSNATIMSIPRDTMVEMPSCVDTADNTSTEGGDEAQITTSLQWGPSCTQKAVHELTGLTIDHYVVVDFSGVETLSKALGGVQVCVTNKMYDRDSGLRLNNGVNTVKGLSALQFVRTRHGFYDGSDLGREKAQHYFLAAMIREVRQHMNLSDAGTLLSVANAATRALTVDDGLSGLTNLMSLATTMNRVPTDRISFVTMPWRLDPTNLNRVLVDQPYAEQMFRNIGRDAPYSSSKGGPPAAASTASADAADPAAGVGASTDAIATATMTASDAAAAAVDDALVHVQVQNGSGITGRAAAVADALTTDGFRLAQPNGNATAEAATTVYYPADRADSAAAVADALGLPPDALQESAAHDEVTVVVGADWPSGGDYDPAGGPGAPPQTGAASAPPEASLENASVTGGCVPVNPPDIAH